MMATLTKHQEACLRQVRGGNHVCLTFIDGKTEYFYALDGRPPHVVTIKSLLRRDLLRPSGDGMFGTTQTLEAA